jgi:hypothetical protein
MDQPSSGWFRRASYSYLLWKAVPVLALTYSLRYKGTPPNPPKGIAPPAFAFLTTKELHPTDKPRSAVNINQQGRDNIAQVGNYNSAPITAAIPFRVLTEDQKRGIAEFLNTLPPSVLVTIGGVYGCGDAVSYAGEFFPLFQARYLDNQTSPSIRTGFPTTFTDVFVATRTEEDSATKYRNAFADALNGLGIPAHRANGSTVPPGDLDFLVGFRPQEVK